MPRTNCSVLGCKSNKKLQQKGVISFHCFPKDIKTRKIWLKFSGLGEVNDSYVICSKHFKKKYFENYLLSELTGQNLKRKLRKKAIPTEYPPTFINPHIHNAILDLNDINRNSGYHRSAEEINTRIKNLKCFYNRIKKDLENGSTTEPTWKHYQAMDEIMTRAIFSVRPNEIPKPSLRYRLEEEKRAREENGDKTEKNVKEHNDKLSIADDNDEDDDDDDDIEIGGTSNNNEDENGSERNSGENSNSNDDNLNTMECEEAKPQLKELEKISAAKIQEININNNFSNHNNHSEDIAVIKNEPIDIDDDDDEDKTTTTDKKTNDDSGDIFPFSDYLKLSAVNNIPKAKKNGSTIDHANAVISAIAANINNKELNVITSNNSKQPAIVLSSPPNNINSTITSKTPSNSQGKISLVPTNFLLKSTQQPQQNIPVQSTLHLRPRPKTNQPQHHIIYTQNPTVQPNVQNGIVNTNSGSMQVLLVNTMQNGAQQQNITTSSIQTIPDITNKSSIFSASGPTQTQLTSSMQSQQNNSTHNSATINLSNMVSAANMEKINLINSGSSTKTPTGYRALLGQLVKTQSENNEIQRQRLRIDRERLEFEKSIVERLFNAVPTWLRSFQQATAEQFLSNPKDKSVSTDLRNNSREKSNSLDDNACVSIPIKMEKDIE